MNQNFIKSKLIFLFCCLYFSLQAQTLKNTKITADRVEKVYTFYFSNEGFPQNDYQEKRFALVVAVAQYSGGLSNLPNNINDANDMTKVLNQCGFDVMQVINPTKEELQNAIKHARKFYIDSAYNISYVYFSGHGAQLNATNFIMPSDAFFTRVIENKNNLKQFFNKSLLLSDLTGVFDQPQTKYSITVLDACRSYDYILKQKNAEPLIDDINFINLLNQDNEKVEMKGKNALFLPIEAGEGTPAIGPNNRNSFFTYYLLKAFEKKPSNVADLQDKLVEEMKSINQSPIFKGGAYKYRFQFYAKGSSIITDRDVNVNETIEFWSKDYLYHRYHYDSQFFIPYKSLTNNKWGIKNGIENKQPIYDTIYDYGYYWGCIKNGLIGFLGKDDGVEYIKPKYFPFKDGAKKYYGTRQVHAWGESVIIDSTLFYPSENTFDLVLVKRTSNDLKGIIINCKTDKIVINEDLYDSVIQIKTPEFFKENYHDNWYGYHDNLNITFMKNNKIGFIDILGVNQNNYIEAQFNREYYFIDGGYTNVLVSKNNKWGIIDIANSEILVDFIYDERFICEGENTICLKLKNSTNWISFDKNYQPFNNKECPCEFIQFGDDF
jgi:hypothetical protein